MFKIYLADDNYNIIAPLDISNGGVTSLQMTREVGRSRELSIQFNTWLEEQYDYLLSPETKLVVIVDNQVKIGFTKDTSIVTHLCSYAEIGAGSDFNATVKMDNSPNQDPYYPVIPEVITDSRQICNYILDTYTSNKYKKKYYKIKAFNYSNLTQNNISNATNAKQKLYSDSVNFLKGNKDKTSITSQIRRQNGVCEVKFFSSSFEMNYSKRSLLVNQDYSGLVSGLVANMASNITFKILKDVKVTLNTGTYSNFELLDQICKESTINWREIGLDVDNKTIIEIGDFDKLLPTHLAQNMIDDDWFDRSGIRIKSIKDNYPSISIDFESNEWIQEGDNIRIVYREFINGRTIFDINTIQNYKGSTTNLLNYV